MRLRLISEIQRKWPTTNMDRSNSVRAYAASSMNDYYHVVHPGSVGHGQRRHRKKPKKTQVHKDHE